uniref:GLTP domain-containing protein n=2 Tax=Caenorhabditis japonica TaxID=281687 RepID=A0A8R1I4X7_CAEJA
MEKSKRPETYRIMHTLERTIIANDDVDLEQYLLLWKHICRIMSSWSTIFSFVVKDVMNKAEKLTEMLERDAVAYKTIMSMAQKEDENGTIRNKKPNRSGTGHLLVLNR